MILSKIVVIEAWQLWFKMAKKIIKEDKQVRFEIMQVVAFINGIKHTFTGNVINMGEGAYIIK